MIQGVFDMLTKDAVKLYLLEIEMYYQRLKLTLIIKNNYN